MNHNSTIHFGTDGWRAVIADEFTFQNVRVVAQAWADFLKANGTDRNGAAVSYDTRFLSKEFAQTIADVLTGNQIEVFLSDRPTPTPALSWFVAAKQLAGGIMVTASHNPYQYNGIKFKAGYGGPVLPQVTSEIQTYLKNASQKTVQHNKNFLLIENLMMPYSEKLKSFVNFDLLQKASLKIISDPMYGAGIGVIDEMLAGTGINIQSIHNRFNPIFDGKHPEPVPANLTEISHMVPDQKCNLGIATDGDADRFGIISEKGEFIQLHDLMPLLFEYLVKSRGWEGDIVRTSSMASTIDKVAEKYGRTVLEVPVGFKNVTEVILEKNILIGGEESGGFGYKNYIPERDGILSNLLVLEMLASYQLPISELILKLREEFGPFAYGRIDEYHNSEVLLANLHNLKALPPSEIAGFKIISVDSSDGIKFYFENDTWMLIRVSQTEPLARIYVASTIQEKVNKILDAGKKIIIKN